MTKQPKQTDSEQEIVDFIELNPESHPKFLSRVSSIPVVHDGLSTVQAIANKSSLGRLALSTANSTLTTVSRYSQPTCARYESYIEKADAFGCRSLDLIQTKFPVVNQPTENIVKAVNPYQIVNVKDTIDSTFKQPANQVAKEANKRFGTVVDNVEAVLNRYLPKEQEEQETHTKEEVNQALRAYSLLNDLTIRLSQRVQQQIKTTTAQFPRSPSDLARIAETSDLIQRTTVNIQSLQESLAVYQRLLPFKVLHETTLERLQGLTGQVSTQLQQVIGYLKTQETPEWLRARMASLVDIANKQTELIRKEYARQDVSSFDKVKNVTQDLQSQVLPVLQTIQAQLNHYTHLARHDLKTPFEYLGLTHTPKLAQAQ
ncbi:hypothetical protein G6F46_006553 [Rhizopus delemar]|uniref:Perilipin n=3 Tax=Rhizopus TaxID=4842 RepID=I1BHP1_RHIO9|nr:hypothetical protein RO3G_00425 [Rhizopus delemar RA 99-880]KAG1057182.1 hypothetical protein G6F43_000961 [Rhizopus delemar]KAG1543384.1 hypothetical protein G6F51_006712 [Rhizopus arrhizus]KAG1458855.1 hypothetical protein G6F55_005102 [Rhizopus delemar]KAG1498794.1 hypothetical protein G6F54_004827 [Rhizopus delemar]|eukprot:EIE75721.1 hypothetical protein RO3G_00425 [Rhizopus delemar RA 99-880]